MNAKVHRTTGKTDVAYAAASSRALAVMLAAVVGLVGLAAVSIARGANQSNVTVSLRKTPLGTVLVSSNGHTLYLFEKDSNGKSACSSNCAQFWPPLLSSSKPAAGPGVNASLLGRTRRSNGSMQVIYNKHPLYAYVVDKGAGQTKGEGISAFGAKWYALSGKGSAVIKSTPMTTTTTKPYP
jgi:predicted lipoprotein with Yx(FWY)xxD motif